MSYYIKTEAPQNLMYLGDIMLEHPEVVDGDNLPSGYAKVETVISGTLQPYDTYVRDVGYEDGPRLENGVWVLRFIPKRLPDEIISNLLTQKEYQKRDAIERHREPMFNIANEENKWPHQNIF